MDKFAIDLRIGENENVYERMRTCMVARKKNDH